MTEDFNRAMTGSGPLHNQGLLRISGRQAKQFLQGQLTCDLHQLQPGTSVLAACCNAQGRVISNFILHHSDNHHHTNKDEQTKDTEPSYYLSMQRVVIAILQAHLQKYSIFFQVNIQDLSAIYRGYYVFHPKQHPDLMPSVNTACIHMHYQQGQDQVNQYWLAATDQECLGQKQWQQKLMYQDDAPWQLCNMYSRLAYINEKTSGQFTPHMLNLEQLGAISFTKGCYTGQEIIARTHYRGTSKKRTYLLRCVMPSGTQQKPVIMQEIYTTDGQHVGNIISICLQNHQQGNNEQAVYLLLAVIGENHRIPNAKIYLDKEAGVQLEAVSP